MDDDTSNDVANDDDSDDDNNKDDNDNDDVGDDAGDDDDDDTVVKPMMTCTIYQNVLWANVTVDNTQRMTVQYRFQNLITYDLRGTIY